MTSQLTGVARQTVKGTEIRVRLTPKSSVDRVDGVCETPEGPALAARVRALPADGEANNALVRLIADWLDLAKSSVSLSAGQKSRIKTVTVRADTGISPGVVDALVAGMAGKSIKTNKF